MLNKPTYIILLRRLIGDYARSHASSTDSGRCDCTICQRANFILTGKNRVTEQEDLFMVALERACQWIEQEDYSSGRPPLPMDKIVYALILKVHLNLSAREVVKKIAENVDSYAATGIPSYNSLISYLRSPILTRALWELLARTEHWLSIDDSDFQMWRGVDRKTLNESICLRIGERLNELVKTGFEIPVPVISEVPESMDGSTLLEMINRTVPQDLPVDIRSEVCQEMIMAVLMNQEDLSNIGRKVGKYIKRVRKMGANRYELSLDEPMNEDGSITLGQALGF